VTFTRYHRRWALALVALVAAGAFGYSEYRQHARTAALFTEGEAALAARDYGPAREKLEAYLLARPTDSRARLLSARAARQVREYRAARDHLKALRAAGQEAEAVALEEQLLEVRAGHFEGVPALRARAKRDDELALVALEVLIQHDLDTYQLASARTGFTRYLELRPTDLHALLGRAFVWERFMNFADALEDYRRAVAAHPDSTRARLKLAETALLAGTPAEALAAFEWLAARDAQAPAVRLGLARCHRRLARPDEAKRLLSALRAEFPDHWEVLWESGEIELEGGAPEAAEPLLRRATAARPFDRRPHYALYRCLLRLDRHADAERASARVKQLDADVSRINELRDAVIQKPNDAALRAEGGVLFLRNGERAEGVRWLELALRLDPTCEPARRALEALGAP
jgi:tetratricopeptide (TPR) repeat protein